MSQKNKSEQRPSAESLTATPHIVHMIGRPEGGDFTDGIIISYNVNLIKGDDLKREVGYGWMHLHEYWYLDQIYLTSAEEAARLKGKPVDELENPNPEIVFNVSSGEWEYYKEVNKK